MTKQEKVLFLQQYQAGKRALRELLPPTLLHFHDRNGIVTDDNGEIVTREEIKRRETLAGSCITVRHVHSEIPITHREEVVDMTPWEGPYYQYKSLL